MKLTAIVLCLNAAETLPQCLQSLKFCDEIIIADDGSTDGSIAIATNTQAKIVSLTPTDSFAQKRNLVLREVNEGWALFVDADEVVSPELAHQIQVYRDSGYDGFFIKRQDLFLGRVLEHGEAGGMWLLRMARVGAGNWRRAVHETWAVSGNLYRLMGALQHYPHPSVSSFLQSINYYTSLEIKERVRSGRSSQLRAWLELVMFPQAKFFQNYILRLGFLDGIPGFIHAYIMSLHSLLTRIKILEYVRAN